MIERIWAQAVNDALNFLRCQYLTSGGSGKVSRHLSVVYPEAHGTDRFWRLPNSISSGFALVDCYSLVLPSPQRSDARVFTNFPGRVLSSGSTN